MKPKDLPSDPPRTDPFNEFPARFDHGDGTSTVVASDGCMIGISKKVPGPPDETLIRSDNPHFGPKIRIVEEVSEYDGMFSDRFSHQVTVGAYNSVIKAFFAGERDKIVDAWATYLYDKNSRTWRLGAN